ncbi:hypothetical protein CPC08DRAFT_422614 [Agrocybe pediades]|nr:hypothetical protein CPC08DRAFT_422614 [Agrocybe pediades]
MYPHGVCVDFEAGRIVDTERSYLDQNEDDQYHFQVRAEHLDNDTLFPTPMDDATSPNESDFSLNGSMPPPCAGPIGWNHQQPVDVLIMPLEVAPGNPLCFDPSLIYPFLSGPSESPIDFPNPNPYRALSTQGARGQPVQDSLAASLESDWEFVENWLRKEEMLPLPDQFPSCTPHQLITPRTPSPSSVPPALTPASTDTSSTTLSSPDPSTMNCFQLPVYLQEQQSSPSHVESVRARPGKAKTPEKNRKPGLSFAGPATSCPPSGHMMAPRTPSPPPFWLSPPSLTPASTDVSSSALSTPDSSTMAGSQLPIYIRQQGSPTCIVESDRVGRGRVQKKLRASSAKQKEAAAAAKVKSKPRRRKEVGADSQNATVAGSGSEAQPRRRRLFTSKLEDIRGYQFTSSDHQFQC